MNFGTVCSQSGKIYMIIFMSMLFTFILSSISKIANDPENKPSINETLIGTGIFVNIVSIMYTLHLLKIDLFGECHGKSEKKCHKNCKWFNMSPFKFDHKCIKNFAGGYLYVFIFLLCSVYLVVFGVSIIKDTSDQNHEKEITKIAIASLISGTIGILFTVTDLILYNTQRV